MQVNTKVTLPGGLSLTRHAEFSSQNKLRSPHISGSRDSLCPRLLTPVFPTEQDNPTSPSVSPAAFLMAARSNCDPSRAPGSFTASLS